MKKILKNRLFIFILGGIIFGSIGVYAATTYSSNLILYKSSNGNKNLNIVLDELYERFDNENKNKIIDLGIISSPKTFDLSEYNISNINIDNFVIQITSKTQQTVQVNSVNLSTLKGGYNSDAISVDGMTVKITPASYYGTGWSPSNQKSLHTEYKYLESHVYYINELSNLS